MTYYRNPRWQSVQTYKRTALIADGVIVNEAKTKGKTNPVASNYMFTRWRKVWKDFGAIRHVPY